MSLSTAHLRDEFRTHLEQWEGIVSSNAAEIDPILLAEIPSWSMKIEKFIQEKIKLLEMDFNDYPLKDEYLRSVSEGFDDLERIMRTQKTLLDAAAHHEPTHVLKNIKLYYKQYFIPLFNILSKLENDYIAITTSQILENTKKLSALEVRIKSLKKEKRQIKNRFLSFIRASMSNEIKKNIDALELQRKLLRLTIQHDKLNLYYFSHERPPELKNIKEKADILRAELREVIGVNHDDDA